MINSITTEVQVVAPAAAVLFLTDRIKTKSCKCSGSGWLNHEPGSSQFLISKPGYYEVNYGIDAANVTGVDPIVIAVNQNGENIAGSLATITPAAAGDYGHLSNSVLIFVPCGGSVIVTINNAGTLALNAKNATISIKRLS